MSRIVQQNIGLELTGSSCVIFQKYKGTSKHLNITLRCKAQAKTHGGPSILLKSCRINEYIAML